MENSILFSGYNWLVKQSSTKAGPGPNFFSERGVNVINGELKLEVVQEDGNSYCSEIFLDKPLGYGRYLFQLSSGLDLLQDDVVFALFTWDDNYEPLNCEIDIEFSRWGDSKNKNTQFVIQPHDRPSNKHRFDTKLNGDFSTHIIEWMPRAIHFHSYHGHVGFERNSTNLIQSWSYTGSNIPHPANERVHINLWKTYENRSKRIRSGISFATIHRFMFEPFL